MSVQVTYKAMATVAETIAQNTGSAPASTNVVTHTEYDEAFSLSALTTPPATKVAEFLMTLDTGAFTIDLRDLTGTNAGVIDGNGLKVQVFRFKNLGANTMTLTFGGSNPYNLLGSAFVVDIPAGAHFMYFGNDATPDIASGAKEIDVTGTGAQTAEVTIIMG